MGSCVDEDIVGQAVDGSESNVNVDKQSTEEEKVVYYINVSGLSMLTE